MRGHDLVRVFVEGGIISPGDFLKIIHTAKKLGADFIHLGSRQDILFPISDNNKKVLDKTFYSIDVAYDINEDDFQNISSSYVSLDVMPSKKWLVPHIYHYILDSFDYRPKLRINIVDPSQSLVPLFTGNINFIAAAHENYWYVYLRFKRLGEAPWVMPVLVYGFDLARLAKAIEKIYWANSDFGYEEMYDQLMKEEKLNTQVSEDALSYPDTTFPYYEGLNRITDDKYWLGLYWRNNRFDIRYLEAICHRCIDTNIGKMSLTPWKSIIIKGIRERHRMGWEKLTGKYGINLRHSSLELNWHLPALDMEALELKNYLVRTLDQQDISTYGLTFTIKPTDDIVPFTSVVIERNREDNPEVQETYNILYSEEFNPNLTEYHYYARDIAKEIIPALLIELSFMYYEQLEEGAKAKEKGEGKPDTNPSMYQCKECLTVYDESFGDATADIPEGTSFEALPETYCCTLCGTTKDSFIKMA